MMAIAVSGRAPSPVEYIDLRARAGWGAIDQETATRTIHAASFTACLRDNDRLIGLVRAMGDGVLYFFLADLIIDPDYRGGGHGDTLMRLATEYFDRNAKPGASITLVALDGRETFYERFGFVRCPNGPFGMGMHYAPAPSPR
jgi:predicted N-acetyltransferase YhbS